MLVFFILLLTFITLLAITTVQIHIKDLNIQNNKRKSGEIKIVLKILNIIPYIKINLLKNKLMKNINIKKMEKKLAATKIKVVKNDIKNILEKVIIERLYIKINLQSNNLIPIIFLSTTISTILSIIFTKKITKRENGRYEVNFEYNNSNRYEIYISGKVKIKFIHIITAICKNLIKRKDDKNVRKSYRRAYGYNNE